MQIILFALASLGLISVSRASLRVPGSHGFYRFFAWEAILALVLRNAPAWFLDPFSARQIASWFLLLVSLFLVMHALLLLGSGGMPDPARQDPGLLDLEKTTRLVTRGAYRFIRHPLYSPLLFLAWGAFLKQPDWISALISAAASAFLWMTARVEEGENRRFFGPAYEAYQRRTKMFIPFLI